MFTFAMIAERLLLVLGIIIAISQILIPLAMDKPMFWLFRKKARAEFFNKEPVKSFDETVDHLKTEKEKTAKATADLDADIENKVNKVNELKNKTDEQ